MRPDLHVVVLAAGKGTRMKSARPKVLHTVGGVALIEHVLRIASSLQPQSITVVVGHQAQMLQAALSGRPGLTFVVQEPQLGTGHALLTAAPALERARGHVVLLSGDVPLLSGNTLKTLVDRHTTHGARATVVTAVVDNPHGYGRCVRRGERLACIVEERDATPEIRSLHEINAGIYAFALEGLFETLREIGQKNTQGEYYLPDLFALYAGRGAAVETVTVADADEIRGINTLGELEAVNRTVRARKNDELMTSGVTIADTATAYVDEGVAVGPDTILHPSVTLEGSTSIGRGCEIHSGVRIVNSRVGDNVIILNHSIVIDSTIANGARIGPFAHLRPETVIAAGARVGNFVELKKTVLGAGSKANHLSYLGDATIGANVNVGAGTITCNYDGEKKEHTVIEDGAFIGSDSQLIAPVTIGKGAYVGSGATIRENVPPGALAVTAGKQRNIEGWAEERAKAKGKRQK